MRPQVYSVLTSNGGTFTAIDEDTMIDEASATVTYIGKAATGSATSSAVWKIKKIETIGAITSITYAGGVATYVNIYDNRASLTYS